MRTSVALCTHNGERFIQAQLESILNQTVAVQEVVILDDKSTDNTIALLEGIRHRFPSQIKLHRNDSNLGAINSFEKCIQLCTGDVIFLSDQDDRWLPFKVEKMLAAFKADEQALAIFSDGELMDDNEAPVAGTLWSKWGFTKKAQRQWRDNDFAFAELLANHNVITGATLAFKRQLLPYLVPIELPVTYWHDLWIGLVAAGLDGLRFVAEPTIQYRIHSSQQVGVTSGANDRRYQPVTHEVFYRKVAALFPRRQQIVARQMAGEAGALPPGFRQRLVHLWRRVSLFKF